MYNYPARVWARGWKFSFLLFSVLNFPFLSQFVEMKLLLVIMWWDSVCCLEASLVLPQSCFSPFFVSGVSQWNIRLLWVLRLWNGQFLCGSPVEQFVNYASGFPYRDNLKSWEILPPPLLQVFSVAWESLCQSGGEVPSLGSKVLLKLFILTNSIKVANSRKNNR